MINPRILVVGDVIVDVYTYVTSERTSQESPGLPVWDEGRRELRLGGAANVANNIKSLCGDTMDVYLSGLVDMRSDVPTMLAAAGVNSDYCFTGGELVKHRYVDDRSGGYVGRFDRPRRLGPDVLGYFEMMFGFAVPGSGWDAVVVSDYDKGTVSNVVVDHVCAPAIASGSPVVVDSKRHDLRMFRGATVLKVNAAEYDVQVASRDHVCPEELFDYVVVTRGHDGSDLMRFERRDDGSYRLDKIVVPVDRVPVRDVTGCGDTHTAAMAFCLARGDDVLRSVKFANVCAASVVSKFGTSTVDPSPTR